MDYAIRTARADDIEAIAAFATDTFEWGDYVVDALPRWLDDPTVEVKVAVGEERAIGMAACSLLSPAEAWVQGARIHPDARRLGIGSELNRALTAWAASHGALVARLAIEDWNEAPIRQVAALGYRPTCHWVYAKRAVGAASPIPEGNGGQRVATAERLSQAPSGEAGPAYLSWTSGPIAKAARGLFAAAWKWRRMTIADLEEAGRNNGLWEGRPGWAMAAPRGGSLEVGWLETSPDDAYSLARALVDLAASVGQDEIEFMVPMVDWLVGALKRAGCDIEPLTVYSLPLG